MGCVCVCVCVCGVKCADVMWSVKCISELTFSDGLRSLSLFLHFCLKLFQISLGFLLHNSILVNM